MGSREAGAASRALLVLEADNSFLQKYVRCMAQALGGYGISASAVAPRSGYQEALRMARDDGASRLHFCFLLDPRGLYQALRHADCGDLTVTYSVFGVARQLREPVYREFHERLVELECVRSVLVHSISPDAARAWCRAANTLQAGKVHFVHDPVYDSPDWFDLDASAARRALGLCADEQLALYFGSFSQRKAPDLFVAAASSSTARFLLAGRADWSWLPASPDLDQPNVELHDREIDDMTAAKYFVAADVVVLPYRESYQFDTSGVLVQACLAGKPIVAPALPPFERLLADRGLGVTFACDDADDLARAIRHALRNTDAAEQRRHCAAYVGEIESWKCMAELLMVSI
jgi:glycosyltransferase involved in cell wall biosynthesis